MINMATWSCRDVSLGVSSRYTLRIGQPGSMGANFA